MSSKFTFVTLAVALAALHDASASPITNATVASTSDDIWGNLYVCTDANWSGNCDNIWFENSRCWVLPTEYQNDVTSIGPPEDWYCYGYVDYNCEDDFIDFQYPGISDLGDGNTNYNDKLKSFVCYHAASQE